uniref:VWFC domain-containing protein n=1 Tax=Anopheles coluzzii TaxID=1518534 RepID=A0A8W7PYV5_ANOCL
LPESDEKVQPTVSSTTGLPVAFDAVEVGATSEEEHDDAEQPQTDDLNADDESSEEAESLAAVTTPRAPEKVSTTAEPASTPVKEVSAEELTPKPEVYTTVAAESDSQVTEQPTTVQQEAEQTSTEVTAAHADTTTASKPSQDEIQTTAAAVDVINRDEEQHHSEAPEEVVSQEPAVTTTSTAATTAQPVAAETDGPVRESSQPATTTQEDLASSTVAAPVAAQDDKLDEKVDEQAVVPAVPEKPQPVSDDSEEQQEAVKPTFTEDEHDDQQKVQEPEVVGVSEESSSLAKPTQQPETVGPSYGAPGQHYDTGYGHMPPHYPPSSYEDDYGEEEDPAAFGPGTCRYGGKLYVSAQQIPRDDPCDFCFCFRSDIICLQQSCPPPISGCNEEPIAGFCCPRYECPVSMATVLNVTTSTTTTTTTLPPHFLSHAYKGHVQKRGCQIQGKPYNVGETVASASGPCMRCTCGGDGQMQCEPKACSPEPMLQQMIAVAAARRR